MVFYRRWGIGGVRPSNQNGWLCRKDGASFHIHRRLRMMVKFRVFHTQTRTSQHTVDAWPHEKPSHTPDLMLTICKSPCFVL